MSVVKPDSKYAMHAVIVYAPHLSGQTFTAGAVIAVAGSRDPREFIAHAHAAINIHERACNDYIVGDAGAIKEYRTVTWFEVRPDLALRSAVRPMNRSRRSPTMLANVGERRFGSTWRHR